MLEPQRLETPSNNLSFLDKKATKTLFTVVKPLVVVLFYNWSFLCLAGSYNYLQRTNRLRALRNAPVYFGYTSRAKRAVKPLKTCGLHGVRASSRHHHLRR